MLSLLKKVLDATTTPLPAELRAQLAEDAQVNSAGYDPWGLHVETAERTLRSCRWLYERYFRVKTHGIEHVPAGRVMLVPNHSGQLPLDGMFVAMAMIFDAHPPRIVRGMVERWFPSLPFISTLFVRCGQTVGDPRNCVRLLERDQAILVFPEGVRGSGKTYWHRYELQRFGTGFVRIALETKTPIVPVAVVGAEETYPSIYNVEWLARLLQIPYVPVTPFWPLLGPLGAVPLPVQIDLHFGEPLRFEGDADAPDHEVQGMVEQVKGSINAMLARGLAARPGLSALKLLPGGGPLLTGPAPAGEEGAA
ncbi:MAG: lysophospholipid acyltransferase family protein [Planctomycetota bacterium]